MMLARIATAFRPPIAVGRGRAAVGAARSWATDVAPAMTSVHHPPRRGGGWTTRRRMSETVQEATAASETAAQAPAGYPFAAVESKWQAYWKEHKTFATPDRRIVQEDGTVVKSEKKKKYVLDMFPYPSGAGLHVGHPEGYTGESLIFVGCYNCHNFVNYDF